MAGIQDLGKKRVAELIGADIEEGEFGTNATAWNSAIDEIRDGVAATVDAPIVTFLDSGLNISQTLLSTDAVGEELAEYALRTSDGTTLALTVFPVYEHTATENFQMTTILRVR